MSSLPEIFVHGMLHRAGYLVPVLAAAVVAGEPLARLLQYERLWQRFGGMLQGLGRKLNRAQRSTATRLYRGMVALLMLSAPALLLGLGLQRPADAVQLLNTLLLVALFGALATPYRFRVARRQAQQGSLTLQSGDTLFADTHAHVRYLIRDAALRLRLVIGAGLYFVLADMPGLLLYLTWVAAQAWYDPQVGQQRAFGWAAQGVGRIVQAVPHALLLLLSWLAACAVPRTYPWQGVRHWRVASSTLYGWMAYLLGIALGGPTPCLAGEVALPWLGNGTPKPESAHLSRALAILGLTQWLWIVLLSASVYIQPLHK